MPAALFLVRFFPGLGILLLVGLGGLLVGVAAVVRLEESASLEDHRAAGADEPLERQGPALGALALDRGGHGLEELELMPAALASIVVRRHGYSPSSSGGAGDGAMETLAGRSTMVPIV